MYQVDRIDLEIMEHLSNNARISNKDLAKKVGIAASTCLERIRMLKVKQIIKGYYVNIDLNELGDTLQAMVIIRIGAHSKNIIEEFYNHALKQPEVMSIYHLSGANDFMVRVATKNTKHLKDFILNAFAARQEVSNVETSLIYEQTQKHQFSKERYLIEKE